MPRVRNFKSIEAMTMTLVEYIVFLKRFLTFNLLGFSVKPNERVIEDGDKYAYFHSFLPSFLPSFHLLAVKFHW